MGLIGHWCHSRFMSDKKSKVLQLDNGAEALMNLDLILTLLSLVAWLLVVDVETVESFQSNSWSGSQP